MVGTEQGQTCPLNHHHGDEHHQNHPHCHWLIIATQMFIFLRNLFAYNTSVYICQCLRNLFMFVDKCLGNVFAYNTDVYICQNAGNVSINI